MSLFPILAALAGIAAQAPDSPRIDPVQPAETARYPDAAEVARGGGLTEAEAARRLRLQEVSAPHVSKLRREFAGRLAGIYRESEGDYRLVVRLKGDPPIPDRWIGTGRDRMRIQFLAGAPATLAETLEKLAASMADIGALLPGLMGTGVDERSGEVILNVHAVGIDVESARAAEPALERLLGHPVRIEFSSARIGDGQATAPSTFKPGTPAWDGHMRRLVRAPRDPGHPHPGILNFHNEARPLARRMQADPAFAGFVFKNDNEPHAVVLFTGDAAGRIKPNPHIVIRPDKGPVARAPQSAGPVKHFPQFKFPGRTMEAALSGTLEVRNGCLVVADMLILWPSRARLATGTDGAPVVGGGTGAPLRVGEPVRMGGGTAWTNFRGEGLIEPLPAACAGESPVPDRLWIAGEF